MPNLKAVLQQLQSQRADLEKEINRIDLALSTLGGLNGRGRGRRGGRRHISAAGRKKMVDAQKRRWAKWRAKQR
jgi:hypothetical protein